MFSFKRIEKKAGSAKILSMEVRVEVEVDGEKTFEVIPVSIGNPMKVMPSEEVMVYFVYDPED